MSTMNMKPDNTVLLIALGIGAFWFFSRTARAAPAPLAGGPGAVAGTMPSTGLSQQLGGILSGFLRHATNPTTAQAAEQWRRAAATSASAPAVQAYYGTGPASANPNTGGSGDPYNDGASYASNPAPGFGYASDDPEAWWQ